MALKNTWVNGQKVSAADINAIATQANASTALLGDSAGLRAAAGAAAADDAPINALRAGVASDGVTNVRSAIQTLINTNAGQRVIRFPKGTYRLGTTGATSGSNRITLVSGTRIVCDPGVVFEINQLDYASGTSVFYASGTESAKTALTANIAAGAQQITLPTGGGAAFTRGDLVAVEANTPVTPDTADDTGVGLAREIRMVTVVAGDTLTLDCPLEYAYTTAASAVYSKITPVTDISIEGARFTAGPGVTPGSSTPSPQLTYPIRFKWALRARIENVSMSYVPGGVHLFECYNSVVDGLSGDMLMMQDVPATSAGYVLAFVGATTKCVVNNLRGAECRHVFTTLADERAGGTLWGGPMHCQINDSIGYGGSNGGTAVWDTHEFGRHIEFNNCQAIGGLDPCVGFQIRSQYTTLNNCRAFRARIGIRVHTAASHVRIVNPECAFNRQGGIVIDGADNEIVGGSLHDNGGAGLGCYFATCTDLFVDGANIYNNTNYGVQATDAVRPRFFGLNVPFSTGKQTTSYQSLSGTSQVLGGSCMGYGSGSMGTPGSTGSPAAGAVINDVLFDGGVVGNRPFYIGGSGGAPVFDTIMYRPSFNRLRIDAVPRFNDGQIEIGDPAGSGINVFGGTGSPEGTVTAPVNSLYIQVTASALTFWRKASGTGNTGWTAS